MLNIKTIQRNGRQIVSVQSDDILIKDTQSALDMISTITYDAGCSRIILNKSAITEDFFKLSTCLAGEILQKFINYSIKIAIIGDYSGYTSKPLKDFIYESNQGNDIFFVNDKEEAIQRLSK